MSIDKITYNLKRFFLFFKPKRSDRFDEINVFEFSQEILKLTSIDRRMLQSTNSVKKLGAFEKELQTIIKMLADVQKLFEAGESKKAYTRFRITEQKYLRAVDRIYGIERIKNITNTRSN